MCIGTLSAYMFLYHVYAWCTQNPEEDVRSIGNGITDRCESPTGCWKLNSEAIFSASKMLCFFLNYAKAQEY